MWIFGSTIPEKNRRSGFPKPPDYPIVVRKPWGIEPHIAKRRTPHGSGLGKVRWVVERTISWVKGLRRLRVRYDRLGVIMDAWTTLAASVICFRILHHDVIGHPL